MPGDASLADDTETGKHIVTDISNGDELEREKKKKK